VAIAIDKANIGTRVQDPVNLTSFVTTNQAVASGGFIICLLAYWANGTAATLSSVADNGGGGSLTWAIDRQGQSGNGGGNPHIAIVSAQAPAGLASGTTITFTYSTSLTGGFAMMGGTSYTGVETSSALDTSTAVNDTTGTTWACASTTILAGSVLFGGVYNFSANTSSGTPTGTEAFDVGDASGNTFVANYRIESSAGAYTVGGTWAAGAANAVSISAAYKEAAGGGGPAQQRRPRAQVSGWY